MHDMPIRRPGGRRRRISTERGLPERAFPVWPVAPQNAPSPPNEVCFSREQGFQSQLSNGNFLRFLRARGGGDFSFLVSRGGVRWWRRGGERRGREFFSLAGILGPPNHAVITSTTRPRTGFTMYTIITITIETITEWGGGKKFIISKLSGYSIIVQNDLR